MSEATDKITEWTGELKEYSAAEWDRMPEIYLYMDQVMTYMEKQLSLFERSDSPLLTSSMINNYVKDGVLSRPERKKYSREHLAMLTVICMLKQVLSIQDLSWLIKTLMKDARPDEVYDRFRVAQSAALKEVSARVEAAAPQGNAELTRLAIELSVEAHARRTVAERILNELSDEEKNSKTEKKD